MLNAKTLPEDHPLSIEGLEDIFSPNYLPEEEADELRVTKEKSKSAEKKRKKKKGRKKRAGVSLDSQKSGESELVTDQATSERPVRSQGILRKLVRKSSERLDTRAVGRLKEQVKTLQDGLFESQFRIDALKAEQGHLRRRVALEDQVVEERDAALDELDRQKQLVQELSSRVESLNIELDDERTRSVTRSVQISELQDKLDSYQQVWWRRMLVWLSGKQD